MKEQIRIFISSSWQDLQLERETVEKALQRIRETTYASMEFFGSRNETAQEVSLAEVNCSNVYLGIFGHRYGSGITEAEYRLARERNLPCLIYIKDDTVPVPPAFVERDQVKIARLGALKNEIRANHTVSYFINPDQLATQVVADLHNLLGGARRMKEEPPKYSSKYQINIAHADHPVIGDDAQINNYFSTATMDDTNRYSESWEPVFKVDILLVTVAEIEANRVLKLLKERFRRSFKPYFRGNKTYYDLGEIGEARTFMVQSEQGTGGPSGALLTIHESIAALSPSAVIMVGIAFGVNPYQQHIGDILISQRLQLFEHQRVGTSPGGKQVIQPRGDRIQASPRLLDRFRSGLKDWHESAKVQFGLVLSGEKLVDNIDFRDQLKFIEPEAVGGEMEGAGLYAAAHLAKTDWIVVKAICDWADGSKNLDKEEYQKLAADNAARFTFHVIEQGGLNKRTR